MAYENVKKFRCGGCGCEDYHLYADNDFDPTLIMAECQKCKSKTEIKITEPTLRLSFGDDAKGRMVIF